MLLHAYFYLGFFVIFLVLAIMASVIYLFLSVWCDSEMETSADFDPCT